MLDYYPLVKGSMREFATENSRITGTFTVEVLDVSTKGTTTTAKCRRTMKLSGEPESVSDYTVVSDDISLRVGEDIEFKFPIKVGTEWLSPPRRNWIEALDAAVETPAGNFKDCMRVAYLIAQGDGGSGERLYAPGVGLVKVVENDEGEPFTYRLIKTVG